MWAWNDVIPDAACIQEHRRSKEQRGYDEHWTKQRAGAWFPRPNAQGAGVGITTKQWLGAVEDDVWHDFPEGRAQGVHINAIILGGIQLVSLYLRAGLAPQAQQDLLEALQTKLLLLPCPWVVGADWQMTPGQLRETGLPDVVGGHLATTGMITCGGSSQRELDYFMISGGLGALVTSVAVDTYSVVRPHMCVQITLTGDVLHQKVPVLVRTCRAPEDRPAGPALEPRRHEWLWAEGDMPHHLGSAWSEWLSEATHWLQQWAPKAGANPADGLQVRYQSLHQLIDARRPSLHAQRGLALMWLENALNRLMARRGWRAMVAELRVPVMIKQHLHTVMIRGVGMELTELMRYLSNAGFLECALLLSDALLTCRQEQQQAARQQQQEFAAWAQEAVTKGAGAAHRFTKPASPIPRSPVSEGVPLFGVAALAHVRQQWAHIWQQHRASQMPDLQGLDRLPDLHIEHLRVRDMPRTRRVEWMACLCAHGLGCPGTSW
eukprot:6492602-Amphidinium_carterae.2